MRSVQWDETRQLVKLIDQRQLPNSLEFAELDSYHKVATAIKEMWVRGAPAIGAAAAYGLALAAQQSTATSREQLRDDIKEAQQILQATRPTAVNLFWALTRLMKVANDDSLTGLDGVREAMLAEAQALADEDVKINETLARTGAELVNDGDVILHHCNTGSLATVDWGTALGVVRKAHELGKNIHVLLDETRPRLQGARLSSWECEHYGIPYSVIADNAAGHFMRTGEVNIVFVGADRVAANGDVANKIGTYKVAVVARENGIPFFPVVPTPTVDLSLASGDDIPIEERDGSEISELTLFGRPTMPPNVKVRNPAFDVTPHKYVTGIVTEQGVIYPPYPVTLRRAVEAAGTLNA